MNPTIEIHRHWSSAQRNLLLVLAVGMVAVGCSPPPRGDELAVIRKQVDATNVQVWAKQILREHTNRTELYLYSPGLTITNDMVVLSNPPPFLGALSLGRMGPSVSVSPAGASSNRCVSLLYAESFSFGGPGHIIEAGSDDFREATNSECVEWIPGVYYHYVHSP